MKKAVIISCFGWYETRLRPICELLQEDYETVVLLSDFDHIAKENIINRYPECEYISVLPYKKNLSIQRLRSHIGFARSSYYRLEMLNPDLIYALIPPNSVAKFCAKYKIKHENVKLIFDIIDMWPESMPIKGLNKTPPFLVWKDYRNSNLKYADYVFTECELYQVCLKKYLPQKYSTLYLYKELEPVCQKDILSSIKRNQAYQNTNTITLGYLGSINYIIDIVNIKIIVAALVKKYNVSVKIIGDGERKNLLIETLENLGAQVSFYGKIFDENKKFEILSDCNYALNMMVDQVQVGLTTKSIDYFSYGLPLINNLKGDTWKLVDNYGVGINFNGDIGAFLNKIECHNETMHMNAYKLYRNKFTKEKFIAQAKKGIEKGHDVILENF